MKKFTISETKIITFIFLILFIVTGFNMAISLRRGRDSTRKNDIDAVQRALDTYYQKYRTYPLSTTDLPSQAGGKIIGCFDFEPILDKSGLPTNIVVCEWGKSKFEQIQTMVQDPSAKKGSGYLYISDGKKYNFYVSLEGKDEAEYQISTVNKNLHCGTKICNYGRGN